MAMARYTAEGALDASFGTGGIVVSSFGGNSNSAAASVPVQSNGKIIISGYRNVSDYRSGSIRRGKRYSRSIRFFAIKHILKEKAFNPGCEL
jgi:hypothetical protein